MCYKAVDHVNCGHLHFAFWGTLCNGFNQVLIAFVPCVQNAPLGSIYYQRQLVVTAIGLYKNVVMEVDLCIMVQSISLNMQIVK